MTGDVVSAGWMLGRVVRITICGENITFLARIRKVRWRHLKRNPNELNMLEFEFFAPIQFTTRDSRTITFNAIRWSWELNSTNFQIVSQTEGERRMVSLEHPHLDDSAG
jgi:hypothetical protein